AAVETKGIVTVEDHSVIGGLGSAVAEVLCAKAPARLRNVGIRDCFGESGKPDQLYEKYGLTAADVAAAVRSLK
ncbi:MAG: transketolase family protein, partial [Firmicutes bacterium]|nr:transketolase family protein [Bacillota bacterium]